MKRRFCDMCNSPVSLDSGVPHKREFVVELEGKKVCILVDVDTISHTNRDDEGDLCLRCLASCFNSELDELRGETTSEKILCEVLSKVMESRGLGDKKMVSQGLSFPEGHNLVEDVVSSTIRELVSRGYFG